ncbi:MAG TPA: homocysteine S-methyltransferase, partial [Longimicrobiales bacterium]|nr:homocysteine S-methyltransferase [Longimicrobiales bacterium]
MSDRDLGGNPFEPILRDGGIVFLDGGLATALEARGHDLNDRLWSARVLVDRPEEIRTVHRMYLDAGADCIITASYQATPQGFAEAGITGSEALRLLDLSVRLGLDARDAFWEDAVSEGRSRPLVAAGIGPYGAYLADGSEYTGDYDLDQAALTEFHRLRFHRLAGSPADLLALETIPSLPEVRALARLLAETDAWAWFSFTCRDGRHLRDGATVEDAVRVLADTPRVAAVGVNCTHPRYVRELVSRIGERTDRPVLAYPNSGEVYRPEDGSWSGRSDGGWTDGARSWVQAGASIVG